MSCVYGVLYKMNLIHEGQDENKRKTLNEQIDYSCIFLLTTSTIILFIKHIPTTQFPSKWNINHSNKLRLLEFLKFCHLAKCQLKCLYF